MPTQESLYHAVYTRIEATTRRGKLRRTAVRRLALLVTGVIAAQSSVLAQAAAGLDALGLTRAAGPASIARGLRRTLSDARLRPETCYAPALDAVLAWGELRRAGQPAVLIVDESSKADELHLLRLSLAYRGTSLPLCWRVWEQNTSLPAGQYWTEVDALLAAAAAIVPADLPAVVVADRAYDVPAFVDRIAARGWHWVVRAKAASALRFRDARGRERALADVLRRRLHRGGRWKARGQVFKGAAGRQASVVALWTPTAKEPMVTLRDLPCRWTVLRRYDRRFWTEPGFRNSKSRGWRWEDSQVQGTAHHARLLLAMAWASLLALLAGQDEAARREAALACRPLRARPGARPAKPQHPRESLFTLGLRALHRWLHDRLPQPPAWRLTRLADPSWRRSWLATQGQRFLFGTVRP